MLPMQAFAHKMLETEIKVLLLSPNLVDFIYVFQCTVFYTLGNTQGILYCGIVLKGAWVDQHLWEGGEFLPEENACAP